MELSHREKHSLAIVGAYVVFLVCCLHLEWQDHSRADTTAPTNSQGQQPESRERALQRLENGGSIKLDRWHGHDLVLRGDLVVDTEALDDPADEDP